MACADGCAGETPVERPTLARSPQVRASAVAWVFILVGLLVRGLDGPRWTEIAAFAAAIGVGAFYFARETLEELSKRQ